MVYPTEDSWYMRIFYHIRDEKPDEWIMEHDHLTKPQLEAFQDLWTAFLEPIYEKGLKLPGRAWLSDVRAEAFTEGWLIALLATVYQLSAQIGRKKSENEEE
jgi:hypothetical protein